MIYVLLIYIAISLKAQQYVFPKLTGLCLGQKPPGTNSGKLSRCLTISSKLIILDLKFDRQCEKDLVCMLW